MIDNKLIAHRICRGVGSTLDAMLKIVCAHFLQMILPTMMCQFEIIIALLTLCIIASIDALYHNNRVKIFPLQYANQRVKSGRLHDVSPEEDFHRLRSYTQITIGEPKQPLIVIMDTSTTDNWVFSAKCTSKCCTAHKTYDSQRSKSSQHLVGRYTVAYTHGSLEGGLVSDSVRFAVFEALNQTLVAIDKCPEGVFDNVEFDGVLGFGLPGGSHTNTSSIMQQLVTQNVIDTSQFSIYVDKNQNPMMSIGGFAYYAVEGDLVLTKVTRESQWMFRVDSVEFGIRRACKGGCNALIDTKSPYILGPVGQIDALNKYIGAKSIGNGKYELQTCDVTKYPDLSVWIENHEFKLQPKFYVNRVDDTHTCTSALVASSKLHNDWVLGTPFVGPIMVSFDYDALQLGFAKVKADI